MNFTDKGSIREIDIFFMLKRFLHFRVVMLADWKLFYFFTLFSRIYFEVTSNSNMFQTFERFLREKESQEGLAVVIDASGLNYSYESRVQVTVGLPFFGCNQQL